MTRSSQEEKCETVTLRTPCKGNSLAAPADCGADLVGETVAAAASGVGAAFLSKGHGSSPKSSSDRNHIRK